MFACMFVCLFVCSRPISSGTAGPIWLNFFLLAPSWSRDGFRPKKFRIRDPVFPEIRKNPDFRVLFDQFGWNLRVVLTLTQICFNTNKFLDRVSGFLDPVFPDKSGQIGQKSGLTVYHDVIHHFISIEIDSEKIVCRIMNTNYFQFIYYQSKNDSKVTKILKLV